MANEKAVRRVMEIAERLSRQLMQGYATQWNGGPATESDVRQRFAERHGREPQKVVRLGPIWVAGPVEKGEENGIQESNQT